VRIPRLKKEKFGAVNQPEKGGKGSLSPPKLQKKGGKDAKGSPRSRGKEILSIDNAKKKKKGKDPVCTPSRGTVKKKKKKGEKKKKKKKNLSS